MSAQTWSSSARADDRYIAPGKRSSRCHFRPNSAACNSGRGKTVIEALDQIALEAARRHTDRRRAGNGQWQTHSSSLGNGQ